MTGAGDETLRFWNVFSKTRSTKVTTSAPRHLRTLRLRRSCRTKNKHLALFLLPGIGVSLKPVHQNPVKAWLRSGTASSPPTASHGPGRSQTGRRFSSRSGRWKVRGNVSLVQFWTLRRAVALPLFRRPSRRDHVHLVLCYVRCTVSFMLRCHDASDDASLKIIL